MAPKAHSPGAVRPPASPRGGPPGSPRGGRASSPAGRAAAKSKGKEKEPELSEANFEKLKKQVKDHQAKDAEDKKTLETAKKKATKEVKDKQGKYKAAEKKVGTLEKSIAGADKKIKMHIEKKEKLIQSSNKVEEKLRDGLRKSQNDLEKARADKAQAMAELSFAQKNLELLTQKILLSEGSDEKPALNQSTTTIDSSATAESAPTSPAAPTIEDASADKKEKTKTDDSSSATSSDEDDDKSGDSHHHKGQDDPELRQYQREMRKSAHDLLAGLDLSASVELSDRLNPETSPGRRSLEDELQYQKERHQEEVERLRHELDEEKAGRRRSDAHYKRQLTHGEEARGSLKDENSVLKNALEEARLSADDPSLREKHSSAAEMRASQLYVELGAEQKERRRDRDDLQKTRAELVAEQEHGRRLKEELRAAQDGKGQWHRLEANLRQQVHELETACDRHRDKEEAEASRVESLSFEMACLQARPQRAAEAAPFSPPYHGGQSSSSGSPLRYLGSPYSGGTIGPQAVTPADIDVALKSDPYLSAEVIRDPSAMPALQEIGRDPTAVSKHERNPIVMRVLRTAQVVRPQPNPLVTSDEVERVLEKDDRLRGEVMSDAATTRALQDISSDPGNFFRHKDNTKVVRVLRKVQESRAPVPLDELQLAIATDPALQSEVFGDAETMQALKEVASDRTAILRHGDKPKVLRVLGKAQALRTGEPASPSGLRPAVLPTFGTLRGASSSSPSSRGYPVGLSGDLLASSRSLSTPLDMRSLVQEAEAACFEVTTACSEVTAACMELTSVRSKTDIGKEDLRSPASPFRGRVGGGISDANAQLAAARSYARSPAAEPSWTKPMQR